MRISKVIELLQESENLDDEIAIQWYAKADMENDEPMSKEVWNKAVKAFDEASNSDLHEVLSIAISEAQKNLEVKK